MTVQFFEIGTSYATRVNVETLTNQAPNMSPAVLYMAYREALPVGDNGRKAIGAPYFVWSWGFIYADMFTALRVICPGASANVYIRTRLESGDEDNSGVYAYYQAKMVWPELDSYEYRAGAYQPFQLLFTNLVAYTPPS
jgi:hypothetical protein